MLAMPCVWYAHRLQAAVREPDFARHVPAKAAPAPTPLGESREDDGEALWHGGEVPLCLGTVKMHGRDQVPRDHGKAKFNINLLP